MDFAALANLPAPIFRRARSYRAQTITVGPTPVTRPWDFQRFDSPALMLLEHDIFDVRVRITVQQTGYPGTDKLTLAPIIAVGLSSPNLGITPSVSMQTLEGSLAYGGNKGEQREGTLETTFDGFAGAWQLGKGTGVGGFSNGGVLTAVRRLEGCTKASAWPSFYCWIPSTNLAGDPLAPEDAFGPFTFKLEYAVVATRSTWAENAALEAQNDWIDGNIVNETMDNLGWLCNLSPDPALGQYKPEQVDVLTGAASLTDPSHFWSVFQDGAL